MVAVVLPRSVEIVAAQLRSPRLGGRSCPWIRAIRSADPVQVAEADVVVLVTSGEVTAGSADIAGLVGGSSRCWWWTSPRYSPN